MSQIDNSLVRPSDTMFNTNRHRVSSRFGGSFWCYFGPELYVFIHSPATRAWKFSNFTFISFCLYAQLLWNRVCICECCVHVIMPYVPFSFNSILPTDLRDPTRIRRTKFSNNESWVNFFINYNLLTYSCMTSTILILLRKFTRFENFSPRLGICGKESSLTVLPYHKQHSNLGTILNRVPK